MPVPQTDTGGRGENPKTNGRTLVKELGKMQWAAENRHKRLFIKNTGLCEVEIRRIRADSCPVPEG